MDDLISQLKSIKDCVVSITAFIIHIPSMLGTTFVTIKALAINLTIAWGFAYAQRFLMILLGIWSPRR